MNLRHLTMRAYAKILAFVFLFGAMSVTSIHFLSKSDIFLVQDVEVRLGGDNFNIEVAASNAFKEWQNSMRATLKQWVGKKIFDVPIEQVANELQKTVWVSELRVSRSYPNTIRIVVEPKNWIGYFVSENEGMLIPVASDGSLLPHVKMKDVPSLTIFSSELRRKDELRKRAVSMLQQLPREGKISQKTIAEVAPADSAAFVVSIIPSHIKIKLNEESLPLEVARVEKVMEYLDSHELQGRVIDADYAKKVVVKLRKRR